MQSSKRGGRSAKLAAALAMATGAFVSLPGSVMGESKTEGRIPGIRMRLPGVRAGTRVPGVRAGARVPDLRILPRTQDKAGAGGPPCAPKPQGVTETVGQPCKPNLKGASGLVQPETLKPGIRMLPLPDASKQ
jgi:hypothetical protein